MWQNSLGHSVVKATFPSVSCQRTSILSGIVCKQIPTCIYYIVFQQGTKELQLSLFQAIVALLFNETEDASLSYKEIQQLSNIGMLTCDQITLV